MSQQATFRIGVHQILEKEGKILLLKRSESLSFLPNWWWLPGGHHDGNETFESSASREAQEEVGVRVKEQDQKLVHVAHTKTGMECVHFFFIAKEWQGEISNMEPQSASELKWFAIDELPEKLPNFVKIALQNYKNNELTYDNIEMKK